MLLVSALHADGLMGGGEPKYDERVSKALNELDINYHIDEDGDYRVTFKTGDDRSQLVFIFSTTETYRNLEIREITSAAYESETDTLPAHIALRLLKENSSIKMGAWQSSGKLAIFSAKISANADPESLKTAIAIVLKTADGMEGELNPDRDVF
ncbi:hypothetical protein CCR82_05370 [Halochromatium salexigens]|uniref:YbjN domain-containing protein n=2 Tax=Halochromatium salexigens TaxID=49447 RepID=A0AAJ0XFR0_HALSE|nr:hypothetical protein [Halochromatium salexigens]